MQHHQNQQKAFYVIQNLHKWNLAFIWRKALLERVFSDPLENLQEACGVEYGQFVLSANAPIWTTNDGSKAAEAYVRTSSAQVNATSRGSKAAIISGAGVVLGGNEIELSVVLNYFPNDNILRVRIATGPGDYTLALQPLSMGVSEEDFVSQLEKAGGKVVEKSGLGVFYRGALPADSMLSHASREDFFRIEAPRAVTLNFLKVEKMPTVSALLLIFSPSGALIFVKGVPMGAFLRKH